MNYSQIGWLTVSCDSLAGIRDVEKLHRRAKSIIVNRPAWVKDKVVARFSSWIEARTQRLERSKIK